MPPVFLVHGGLWEDMDAARFGRATGIETGLRHRGLRVLAPDRLPRAPDWQAEADHLAAALPAGPAAVVAASNGCSAAVRLALTLPAQVALLVLAWPATAGDPACDASVRHRLARQGATAETIDALLAGRTLRGMTDPEIATLGMPAAVLPSAPANPAHQRRTADALLRLIPRVRELPGCPEPPSPAFAPHRERFLDAIADFTTT